MRNLSCKISDKLAARLHAETNRRGVKQSDIVRHALIIYFEHKTVGLAPSFYELSKDLCGCVEGPKDLSSNPKYMQGYGSE